jgi:hypothetical protein
VTPLPPSLPPSHPSRPTILSGKAYLFLRTEARRFSSLCKGTRANGHPASATGGGSAISTGEREAEEEKPHLFTLPPPPSSSPRGHFSPFLSCSEATHTKDGGVMASRRAAARTTLLTARYSKPCGCAAGLPRNSMSPKLERGHTLSDPSRQPSACRWCAPTALPAALPSTKALG